MSGGSGAQRKAIGNWRGSIRSFDRWVRLWRSEGRESSDEESVMVVVFEKERGV